MSKFINPGFREFQNTQKGSFSLREKVGMRELNQQFTSLTLALSLRERVFLEVPLNAWDSSLRRIREPSYQTGFPLSRE
ncbi:hypothetical protein A1332_21575 [Methylomonas methanica]|uniref:Uncharacterized protein n=1 Tax=Methylomonas methanica TaxID=421 RepID=A0A177LUU9_METMH|nr:hypothetical protein A1332_21575 [Methylomonas methanica]